MRTHGWIFFSLHLNIVTILCSTRRPVGPVGQGREHNDGLGLVSLGRHKPGENKEVME